MSDYWEDNNIEKPQSVIVCAACRMRSMPDKVICGARHFDSTMQAIIKLQL